MDVPQEVVERFASKHNISPDRAHGVFSELEVFLDRASAENISPTVQIDEAWHEFILHTKMYGEYCYRRYGRFVHHSPQTPINCETKPENEPEEDEETDNCASGVIRIATLADCDTTNCVSDEGGKCSSDCRSDAHPPLVAPPTKSP